MLDCPLPCLPSHSHPLTLTLSPSRPHSHPLTLAPTLSPPHSHPLTRSFTLILALTLKQAPLPSLAAEAQVMIKGIGNGRSADAKAEDIAEVEVRLRPEREA